MSDQVQPLCEIKNFSEFLEKCLGRKVLDYTLKRLTKPGDNYGSIMQSVDVEVAAKSDREKVIWINRTVSLSDLINEEIKLFALQTETLHLVSKSSVTNPYLIEVFQPAFTFVKETHFYSDIIPALEHFQRVSNVPETDRIDAFIRCLGSRISLDPSEYISTTR